MFLKWSAHPFDQLTREIRYLNEFYTVYLDDILIYLDNKLKH